MVTAKAHPDIAAEQRDVLADEFARLGIDGAHQYGRVYDAAGLDAAHTEALEREQIDRLLRLAREMAPDLRWLRGAEDTCADPRIDDPEEAFHREAQDVITRGPWRRRRDENEAAGEWLRRHPEKLAALSRALGHTKEK